MKKKNNSRPPSGRGAFKCEIAKINRQKRFGIVKAIASNISGKFDLEDLPAGFNIRKGMQVYMNIKKRRGKQLGYANNMMLA